MANRRSLKKDINYLTYELLSECFAYQHFHKDAKKDNIDKVASAILDNRNGLIARINHVDGKEDPKHVKAYFQKVRKDFDASLKAMDELEK